MGMDQYLLIPFLGDEHPFTRYFDVHQGYYWFWHTAKLEISWLPGPNKNGGLAPLGTKLAKQILRSPVSDQPTLLTGPQKMGF